MSDIFHEVEEDVRRERYEQIWKKYGALFIAAAVLLVAIVAGYQLWQGYQQRQRQDFSERFQAAAQIAASGNAAQAESEFSTLANEAPTDGYAALAKFRVANAQLAQNKRDAAITNLRDLTNEPDRILSGAARLRLAWMLADTAPRAEIDQLVQPLAGEDDPWRFAVAELRAYLDLNAGRRAEAAAAYGRLATEEGASQTLRRRAAAIAQYLGTNTTAPATAPAAAPATPGAAAPAPQAPAAPAPAQETPAQ